MRVLVVEDEMLVRLAAVLALEAEGMEVIEAADGVSAIALIEDGLRVDALFTDVNMPGRLDGFDLAVDACRIMPKLRVLITSGKPASPPYPCNAEFLAKPYDLDDVGRRLTELCRVAD